MCTSNLFEEDGNILIVKGEFACQHDVQDDPTAPYIHLGSSIQAIEI